MPLPCYLKDSAAVLDNVIKMTKSSSQSGPLNESKTSGYRTETWMCHESHHEKLWKISRNISECSGCVIAREIFFIPFVSKFPSLIDAPPIEKHRRRGSIKAHRLTRL